jgi:hypothetical protein
LSKSIQIIVKKVLSVIPLPSHDQLFAIQSVGVKLTTKFTQFKVDHRVEGVDITALRSLAEAYFSGEKTMIKDIVVVQQIKTKIDDLLQSIEQKQEKYNLDKKNYRSAEQYLKKIVSELQKNDLIRHSQDGALDQFFTHLADASEACGSNLFGSVFSAYIELKAAKIANSSQSQTENTDMMMHAIFQDLLIIAYQQLIDSKVLPIVIRLENQSEVDNHLRNHIYQILAAKDKVVGQIFPKHSENFKVFKKQQLEVATVLLKEARKVILGTPQLIDHLTMLVNQIQSVRLKLLQVACDKYPSPNESQDDLEHLQQQHLVHMVQNQVNSAGQTVEGHYITPLGLLKVLNELQLVKKVKVPKQCSQSKIKLQQQLAVLACFKRDEALRDLIKTLVQKKQDILKMLSRPLLICDASGEVSDDSILDKMGETGCVKSLKFIFEMLIKGVPSPSQSPEVIEGVETLITKCALPEAVKFSLEHQRYLRWDIEAIFKKLPEGEKTEVFRLLLKHSYSDEEKLKKICQSMNIPQLSEAKTIIETLNAEISSFSLKSLQGDLGKMLKSSVESQLKRNSRLVIAIDAAMVKLKNKNEI